MNYNELNYNELSRKIFIEYAKKEQDKNVCISTDCVTLGFVVLYLGTGGETRQMLNGKNFMGLYSISRTQKLSSVTGIALLSRFELNEILPQFKSDIKKYCPDENFHHFRIMQEQSDTDKKRDKLVKKINARYEKKTNGAITQIVDNDIVNLYSRGPVTFLCKTKFTATWDRPFNSKLTHEKRFFVKPNISKQVEMMIDDEIEEISVSSMENELNVTAIKLPYKKELGDSYIAIMPNEVASKNELLSLFESLDLNKFLTSFDDDDDCCYLGVPKYTTETDLLLDDGTPNEGLANIEALTDFRGADFSNMFDGGIRCESLKYYVKTIVTVNEKGTQVDATFSMIAYDGVGAGRKIELNRPFLYLIVDRKNYISTIGTFMGP